MLQMNSLVYIGVGLSKVGSKVLPRPPPLGWVLGPAARPEAHAQSSGPLPSLSEDSITSAARYCYQASVSWVLIISQWSDAFVFKAHANIYRFEYSCMTLPEAHATMIARSRKPCKRFIIEKRWPLFKCLPPIHHHTTGGGANANP